MTDVLAPEFEISADRRAEDGSLLPDDRARITDLLLDRGFVLLPSDTAYSVGSILFDAAARDRMNALLDRRDEPISLAFADPAATRRWVAPNPGVERLIAAFCPGQITIVCRTPPRGIPFQLLNEAIAGENRTIGIRVPDAPVEREIAALTAYPITTTAVRDTGKMVVRTVAAARSIVERGLPASGFTRWCVIEDAKPMADRHSTVVDATTMVRVLRPGAIAAELIHAVADGVHGAAPAGSAVTGPGPGSTA